MQALCCPCRTTTPPEQTQTGRTRFVRVVVHRSFFLSISLLMCLQYMLLHEHVLQRLTSSPNLDNISQFLAVLDTVRTRNAAIVSYLIADVSVADIYTRAE